MHPTILKLRELHEKRHILASRFQAIILAAICLHVCVCIRRYWDLQSPQPSYNIGSHRSFANELGHQPIFVPPYRISLPDSRTVLCIIKWCSWFLWKLYFLFSKETNKNKKSLKNFGLTNITASDLSFIWDSKSQ